MTTKYVCCNSASLKKVKTFKKPPKNEPNYNIKNYRRILLKCVKCGNFQNISNIDMDKLYEKDYSQISYGKNLWDKLLKVYNLKKKSDNYLRVNRIVDRYKKFNTSNNFCILDVGAGFGLFLYVLKKRNKNWKFQAIEPDQNNVRFIKNELKIKTTKGFIEKIFNSKRFNLITLNKVLEHTRKPLEVLRKLKKNIKRNGEMYIEVPDGESASRQGYEREEFFIDHHYIFSKKSFKYLLNKAGFKIMSIKKIKEPSNKYTLFAFVKLIKNKL
jgi:2-polyprenyl-3-methyl-5-hydroxy-6-metoxy-1,4-benzoquinol methylase